MNLKHVRTFIAVADAGTVSSAAEMLRITQPALSRQIQALQRDIGLRLFDRVNRRLVPTSNGKEFLRHCRALVSQAEAALASAQSLGRGKTGVLRIGGAAQTIARFFPSFLRHYNRIYPNIRIDLVEASGAQQIEMVELGTLNFAVTIVYGRHEQLKAQFLPPVPLLVISHSRYDLGARSVVDLRRLDAMPVLVGDRRQAARVTFDAVCRVARVTPIVRFEGSAPHTLAALAEAAYGVAVVPGTFNFKVRRLKTQRLQYNNAPVALQLAIQWDDRRPLPPHAKDFPTLFSEHVETILRE